MMYSLVALLFFLPLSPVLGGQFPVIDGVIGGSPKNTTRVAKESASSPAVTAGALRVTENSGVCESPDVYQASGYGDITDNESVW